MVTKNNVQAVPISRSDQEIIFRRASKKYNKIQQIIRNEKLNTMDKMLNYAAYKNADKMFLGTRQVLAAEDYEKQPDGTLFKKVRIQIVAAKRNIFFIINKLFVNINR